MDEEDAKRKRLYKIPLYSVLFAFFMVFCMLMATEEVLDSSVSLNKNLIYTLTFFLLLSLVTLTICDKTIASSLSLSVLLSILTVCLLLLLKRNRVTRLYISRTPLTEKEKRVVEKLFSVPRVLLVAGADESELPEQIVKYETLSPENIQRLHRRVGGTAEEKPPSGITISLDALKRGSFSGIQERLLIDVGSELVTKENFKELGFVTIDSLMGGGLQSEKVR